MTRNSGEDLAACFNCGTQFPAGGRFCPVCGQPLALAPTVGVQAAAPVPAAPIAPQMLPQIQPQGYAPVPQYSAGYGYAPPRARRSRVPILAGLGLVALVLVVGAGVLLASVAGGAHNTPAPSVVALAKPTIQSSTPSPSPDVTPTEVPTGKFIPTGSMTVSRAGNTATLLPDGRVLFAGGWDASGPQYDFLSSAELYDPKTGSFSPTGSMSRFRYDPTATLLRNGRVLVAGGDSDTAELYDPATGKFSQTGTMSASRHSATATLLPDGRVLIAGGGDGCGPTGCTSLASADIYDPATGQFSPTGSMAKARYSHTATLLSDGRVLIAGGSPGPSGTTMAEAEVYDPATGKFSPVGPMSVAREDAAATILKDGRVLIAAGQSDSSGLASVELFDPATGSFTSTGSLWNNHASPTATSLQDGRVLVEGFAIYAELYDPASGKFTQIPTVIQSRISDTATLLADGRVLIAGGQYLRSAEIYEP